MQLALRCRLRGPGMRCACCGSSAWRRNAWRFPAASWTISAGTGSSPIRLRFPSAYQSARPRSGFAPLSSVLPPHSPVPLCTPASALHQSRVSVPGLSTETRPRLSLHAPRSLSSPCAPPPAALILPPFSGTTLRLQPQLSRIPGSRVTPPVSALTPSPGLLHPGLDSVPIPGSHFAVLASALPHSPVPLCALPACWCSTPLHSLMSIPYILEH